MKINQFIARTPALYYSALEDGGPSYLLEGSPGGGKTSAWKAFPKTMARIDPNGTYAVRVINGANFTLMTAGGFMIPKVFEGRDRAIFTDPYWMYTDEGVHLSKFTGGILLIDEYDKLGLDEKKIVGEAALSKMLSNHRLPPGWVVMFAANRMSDRSGSTRDLDHMIMRRITIELTNDSECTVDHYRSINVLPEVVNFAEDNPQLLFEPMDPLVQRPRCSPRTLHQADIHLRNLMGIFDTDKIPTDPLTLEELVGGIGKPAATALMTTIKLGQQLAKYEEVVANPVGATLPSTPDAQRLMSYKVASRVKVEDAKPVMAYMARFPEEHQIMFVRMAVQRNYQIAFQPDFAAWCAKKASLIAILTKYKVESK